MNYILPRKKDNFCMEWISFEGLKCSNEILKNIKTFHVSFKPYSKVYYLRFR